MQTIYILIVNHIYTLLVCRWDLMKSCWAFHNHERPTFSKIKTFLERTVLATKSDWDSSLMSGSECEKQASTGKKKKKSSKTVTFAPQSNVGFIRKCFAFTDDGLFHRRIKAP